MFVYWTTAAALWISIHPYAITLKAAVDLIFDVRDIMKAESDFYNVISLCELKMIFIDTLAAVMIFWTQIAYHRICRDEKLG